MGSKTRYAAAAAALLIALPSAVSGQAVCSAAHSAPSLTTSGAIRLLEPGHGWVQANLYRARSSEAFAADGRAQPFLGGGAATTSSVFVTAAVGLTWGVELWAQVPVHHLRVNDVTGLLSRTGIGDPRISVRLGSELFTDAQWPISIRAGVKLPGSGFPIDSRVLPLTEGQTDYEVALESGWSFQAVPLYVLGWVGYRWRTLDTESGREPGDERYGRFALGGPVGGVSWEVAVDVLDGTAPAQDGLSLAGSRRKLLQLSPSLGWIAGPGRLQLAAQIPVSGRNLPTGSGVTVGYQLAWGGF